MSSPSVYWRRLDLTSVGFFVVAVGDAARNCEFRPVQDRPYGIGRYSERKSGRTAPIGASAWKLASGHLDTYR